jgi:hypothetical protein
MRIDEFLDRLEGVRRSGEDHVALCPAHKDNSPSLSIKATSDGKILVKCFAGCETHSIVQAMGLEKKDLFADCDDRNAYRPISQNGKSSKVAYQSANDLLKAELGYLGKPSRCWAYHNAEGDSVAGAVVRWNLPEGGKTIRPLRRDPDGWRLGAMPEPRPLYNLPEVVKSEHIFITEGEKCADVLIRLGLTGTTSAGGSQAAAKTDWGPLKDKHVFILPDNDAPGIAYAKQVAGLVNAAGAQSIKVVTLPHLPEGGDIADWVGTNVTDEDVPMLRRDLLTLCDTAPPWRPPAAPEANEGPADGSTDWPEPIPLDAIEGDLPPWPAGVLPPWMEDYVNALAESLQVPTDLPALLVLGAAAGGIARKIEAEPLAGWREPANLFAMVCLPPGERKSQTFRAVMKPVRDLERQLRDEARPKIAAAESRKRILEKRLLGIEADIAKGNLDSDDSTLIECQRELAECIVPALPMLVVDNETTESLARELVNQGGRLMVASPEFSAIENISSYSDRPKLDVFLKGHAGDDLKTGRVGRGREEIDRAALTCVFSPQPSVLGGLADSPEMRGRGFLARWLYSLPTSKVGYRDLRPAATPSSIESEYHYRMMHLWKTDYAGGGEPHVIRFSDEAQSVLLEFQRWTETHLRPEGELAALAGWGNKLPGLAVRIAGVLHVAETGDEFWRPLEGETMHRAVKIARYAVEHAKTAFRIIGEDETAGQARRVWKWIAGRPDPMADFSKRDLYRGTRPTFDAPDKVHKPLAVLEQHSLIRSKAQGTKSGPGRRPSEAFEVNPGALGQIGQN